jgi:hypothetical protein
MSSSLSAMMFLSLGAAAPGGAPCSRRRPRGTDAATCAQRIAAKGSIETSGAQLFQAGSPARAASRNEDKVLASKREMCI